jgi:hypothetical protein
MRVLEVAFGWARDLVYKHTESKYLKSAWVEVALKLSTDSQYTIPIHKYYRKHLLKEYFTIPLIHLLYLRLNLTNAQTATRTITVSGMANSQKRSCVNAALRISILFMPR